MQWIQILPYHFTKYYIYNFTIYNFVNYSSTKEILITM